MSSLAAALFLVGFFFIGLPLLAWLLLGEDAMPRFEAFDPGKYANPPEVAGFLRDNIAALEGDQFRQVADLVRTRAGSFTMVTRVAVLEHPDGETATIAIVYSAKTGTALPMVEFTAERPDGRIFDVNNSVAVPAFAPRPGHEVYRFPQVRDPLRLHKIFQVLLRRQFGSSTLRQRDIAADPPRFLAEVIDGEYRAQMEAGYYRLDEKARRWRPTLRGACLMTWKMLPPFKQLAKAALQRRARSVLSEIAMEGRDARPVAAVTTVTPQSDKASGDAAPREGPLEIALAFGGIVLLFAAMFFVSRWSHSTTAGVAVLLVLGPVALWIWARWSAVGRARKAGGDSVARARARSAANRGALPLVVMGVLVVSWVGYREYQAHLPALTVPVDFGAAVVTLGQLTGHEVSRLEGHNDVYVVRVAVRWANRYLSAASDKFGARGFYLSRFDRNFRKDTSSVRLVLVPVIDPFVVVSRIGTQGARDGRTTDDIVTGLRALNSAYPFELRNAGPDWIRGAFTGKVSDLGGVARQMSALCPRVPADDFRGDTVLLQRRIERSGVFICRWS
jgi:hypothetical protein